MAAQSHPIERFEAPASIQTGVPLKEIINTQLVDLIAESFEPVYAAFDTARFQSTAKEGLLDLEFKARAAHIADALQTELPPDFEKSAELLVRSFGPELKATKDNGRQPFFYLPHAELIGRHGASGHDFFEAGMRANYELTKRFTAEFSIRSYLVAQRDRCLERLQRWTADSNPHVRRLVSEGTRPRLPWAMRLKAIDAEPALILPLLERLKDDPELYVRRSVANHLGDIGKAHLPVLLNTCRDWLEESRKMEDPQRAKHRRWVIRHALRHPAKKGHVEALALRAEAA